MIDNIKRIRDTKKFYLELKKELLNEVVKKSYYIRFNNTVYCSNQSVSKFLPSYMNEKDIELLKTFTSKDNMILNIKYSIRRPVTLSTTCKMIDLNKNKIMKLVEKI